MRCLHCDKEIPADALFCIYCGTQIPRAREVQVSEAEAPAATGPTIDLGRKPDVAPPPPPAAAPQPQPQPRRNHSYPQHSWPYAGQAAAPGRRHNHKLGFWLLVLGVFLFFATLRGGWAPGLFFSLPGILLIVGLLSYNRHSARGKHDEALRTLVWLGGLALLFATGMFWPGILVLLGVMTLLRPHRRGWC